MSDFSLSTNNISSLEQVGETCSSFLSNAFKQLSLLENSSDQSIITSITNDIHQQDEQENANNNNSSRKQSNPVREAAKQVARELIEKNVVGALSKINPEKSRLAVRDELVQYLLRQLTGQLPASFMKNSSAGTDLMNKSENEDDDVVSNSKDDGKTMTATSIINTKVASSNSNSDSLLPPGSEQMATLISQGALSFRGAAVTIKRLLDAGAPVRRTALSLLAKVAETNVRERREWARNPNPLTAASIGKNAKNNKQKQQQLQQQLQQQQALENNNKAISKAMLALKPTILDIMKTDPSCAYECHFISRCFGWLDLPTINITSHEALGLVRRSQRGGVGVPCYSVVAGVASENSNINSFVATCSRDAPTIDIFRDVNISGDYAISSFAVPQQFTPLSLLIHSPVLSQNQQQRPLSMDASSSLLVALCCGVEVSERVGLGVISLGENFPLTSQSQCEVREVFGISQPTCGIPVGNSPAIAVGCAVPGGFGVTTVVVETTQRIHTYSSSSNDCIITALAAYGGDCIICASRDGSLELWDLRRNPRGPTQAIVSSNNRNSSSFSFADATTALTFLNNNNGNENLLIAGTYDGLVNIWDLRSTQQGGGVGLTPNMSPLASHAVDGPVLSIVSVPPENDEKQRKNGDYFAVSTTKNLSLMRFNQKQGDDQDLIDEQPTNHLLNRKLPPSSKMIQTEQILACRTTYASSSSDKDSSSSTTGVPIPSLYHDLAVVPKFAGGKHTYILGGSDRGIIEAFRVRYL
jgi:hypothetical protein